MAIIAPSLLSADFLHLQKDCELINRSSAEWYHLDIMDGQFVPNISFGPMLVQFFRKATTKYLDVHLMIVEPEKYIDAFAKAGANNITVHYEACTHLHRTIQHIKSHGIHAGVAINPHTPVHLLEPIIHDINLVCLMSVNPGFGGQSFIPQVMNKIKTLKQLITDNHADLLIEIDGGVTLQNAPDIIKHGCDVLVAGNTVFGSANPEDTIRQLANF